jgi:hypothetical protein
VCGQIRRYWPGLRDGQLVPDYAGIRPKLQARGWHTTRMVILSVCGSRWAVKLCVSPLTDALGVSCVDDPAVACKGVTP